jgi:acetate kinase
LPFQVIREILALGSILARTLILVIETTINHFPQSEHRAESPGVWLVAVLRVEGGTVTEEYRAQHEWTETMGSAAVATALASIGRPVDAVGHPVVHDGSTFREGVRLDGAVVQAIERLIPLAPLHNARALEVIRAAKRTFPDVPGYALFDTPFHAHRPAERCLTRCP